MQGLLGTSPHAPASSAVTLSPTSSQEAKLFKRISTILVAVFAALFLFGGLSQATADGSEPNVPASYADCPLERIGTQLVRCDNLTGAGVDAPFWIPEQE
jgi:hypothetical protein